MRTEIRTFVAIKIKPEEKLQNQYLEFRRLFKDERINWVDPDNFHLTLRFLGNTKREQLYELVDRFELVANNFERFELEINGCNFFKSKGQPRVIFVRASESSQLANLVKIIEEEVILVGFLPELKAFKPHVTLGRIKRIENLARFYDVLKQFQQSYFQKVGVREFILYQSILKQSGPEYRTIKKFELK